MSQHQFVIWTGLFIFLCIIGGWFYFGSQDVQTTNNLTETPKATSAVSPQKTESLKAEGNNADTAVNKTSGTQPAQSKPLNLKLDDTTVNASTPPSIEGPVKPAPNSEQTVIEEDRLQLKGSSQKDKLLYGYEGKDKDDNVNLMIGVQKDDVTIKSGIKKGEDETDVQSIEIEVKLPK